MLCRDPGHEGVCAGGCQALTPLCTTRPAKANNALRCTARLATCKPVLAQQVCSGLGIFFNLLLLAERLVRAGTDRCSAAGLWKLRAKAPTPKTTSVARYLQRLCATMRDPAMLRRELAFYQRKDVKRLWLDTYIRHQKAVHRVYRQAAQARAVVRCLCSCLCNGLQIWTPCLRNQDSNLMCLPRCVLPYFCELIRPLGALLILSPGTRSRPSVWLCSCSLGVVS